MTEPPPLLLWMRVKNADAEDYGRIGMLVDILDRDDDPDLARFLIIDFGDKKEPASFAPDELERVYAS